MMAIFRIIFLELEVISQIGNKAALINRDNLTLLVWPEIGSNTALYLYVSTLLILKTLNKSRRELWLIFCFELLKRKPAFRSI